MSLVITVVSCHRDRDAGCHQSIRRTWGEEALKLGIDVVFFIGGDRPEGLQKDEVWLNVPDSYNDLPYKTQAVAGWFLNSCFPYMFKCDTDTFIVPEHLLENDFQNADYLGTPVNPTYLNGGPGYFLSRAAAQVLCSERVDETAEDRWVGRMLDGLVTKKDGGEKFWRYATWHYPVGIYGKKRYHPDSKWMETMACAHLGHKGYDPRGLHFQDRAENGHGEGEYRVVMSIPGRPDEVRVISEKELKYWQGHRIVKKILSPKW
jgi:Galactosyltransferase